MPRRSRCACVSVFFWQKAESFRPDSHRQVHVHPLSLDVFLTLLRDFAHLFLAPAEDFGEETDAQTFQATEYVLERLSARTR